MTPGEQVVELLVLEHGFYSSLGVFHGQAVLPSRRVPHMSVRVEQFFAFSSLAINRLNAAILEHKSMEEVEPLQR